MPNSPEKKEILEEGGFVYHFDRSIYFNRNLKKIFSFESIEDNSTDWLKQKINEENAGDNWKFYFNSPVSESVRNEIQEMLEA